MSANIVFADGTARLADDIKNFLPNLTIETIFDVGANSGQTLRKLIPAFPDAKFGETPNVSLHRLALGPKSYEGRVTTRAASTSNALTALTREPTEMVPVRTGDEFCAENEIFDLSLLKIDTEGFDHDVLRGFARMLLEGRIDIIQVECSMNPSNRKHVPFETFKHFLEPMGYKLFGLYEQVQEFKRRPVLRRSDAVFISERCVADNTLEQAG
ncbi:MAG: FkbM family methyltransferase [Brevundimonas sp.]